MYKKEDIMDRLTRLIEEIEKDYSNRYHKGEKQYAESHAYALGYIESFMADVLTAFVPACDRHELIKLFDNRIAQFVEKNKEAEKVD